jgi:uncharacterized alpha-E superfamily protein
LLSGSGSMQPETYLARVYECLENAKRTRDQIERERWIEDAVTWHTIARIAEEICAEDETRPGDYSPVAPSH